jgi:hypothetical protein
VRTMSGPGLAVYPLAVNIRRSGRALISAAQLNRPSKTCW